MSKVPNLSALAKLSKDSEEGSDMPIINPSTGEDTGMFIVLAGMHSARFQKAKVESNRKHSDRAQELAEAGSRPGFRERKKRQRMDAVSRAFANIDPEFIEAVNIELLADVTLGWYTMVPSDEEGGAAKKSPGVLYLDEDNTLPFSRENAIKLYTDYPSIRQDVDLFVGEAGNFLKP